MSVYLHLEYRLLSDKNHILRLGSYQEDTHDFVIRESLDISDRQEDRIF